MLKFNCLVLCVVAVSLSSIYAEESDNIASRGEWEELNYKCLEENDLTETDIAAAVQANDASKINPCYWGCYFTMVGLLNDRGQYDVDNYLATMRKLVPNHGGFTTLEYLGKQCSYVKDTPVNDGDAGCELGALVAACFMKYKRH